MYKPPFELTLKIFNLANSIESLLGELQAAVLVKPSVKLRKENKIKTVHHSLAIEGNTLTEEQITALLENKKVIGPKKQVQEVLNALELYESISDLNPLKEKDLLKAHGLLMKGLVESAGKYRSSGVGIIKGGKVSHVAPQAKMVSSLMKDLFEFLIKKSDLSFLLKACIFHYELEFIHPFEDGNGRMGRLWQQAILMKHAEIFEYVSIETLIHKKQKEYYRVLEACDKKGDSTVFIEFSLELILEVLEDFKALYRPTKSSGVDRMSQALEHFGKQSFTRKDYMDLHKSISSATASRDLAAAVTEKLIKKSGEKALTFYKKL